MKAISDLLGVTTPFIWSSEFELRGNRSEKLVNICKDLKATQYISGPTADNYLEIDLFQQNDIEVLWMDYSGYPEYPQLYGPFEHAVTVLDLLFNVGPAAGGYFRYF